MSCARRRSLLYEIVLSNRVVLIISKSQLTRDALYHTRHAVRTPIAKCDQQTTVVGTLLITLWDVRRAVFWYKPPEGSIHIFFGNTCKINRRKPCAKNKPRCFGRTPPCERQTDRQIPAHILYRAIRRRASKNSLP